VARLVDEAHGSPVHDEGAKSVPHFHEAAITAPVSSGANGSGNGNGDTPHVDLAVPAAPAPASTPADPEAWAPPPWPPPANPSTGAPEGPAAR
jgi:hypothetical protein